MYGKQNEGMIGEELGLLKVVEEAGRAKAENPKSR
jgi:hypothetical protein